MGAQWQLSLRPCHTRTHSIGLVRLLAVIAFALVVPRLHSKKLVRLIQKQRIEALSNYEFRQLLYDQNDHNSLSLLAPATSTSGSVWSTTSGVDVPIIHSLASVKDVVQHVCSASSAQELIVRVRDGQLLRCIDQPWTIEYECLEAPNQSRIRFSSKNLFCALAQLIPCEPIVGNDETPLITIHVLDTSDQIHLGWKETASAGNAQYTDAAAIWAARPFVFSAALSYDIAAMCVNILSTKVQKTQGRLPHQCTFFDPCCGSGTTLYAALGKGYGKIVGSDVNVDFVRGTHRNLEYTHGLTTSSHLDSEWTLFVKDAAYSALPWRPVVGSDVPVPAVAVDAAAPPPPPPVLTSPVTRADVIFCNLPWNENVGEYYRENEQILGALASEMKVGCECAFVTKKQLDGEVLLGLGLHVYDVIPIGGSVPKKQARMDRGPGVKGNSREQKDEGEEELKDKTRTGDCYVTFCTKICAEGVSC